MSKKYLKGKPFVPEAKSFNRYEAAADAILNTASRSGKINSKTIARPQKIWVRNDTGATVEMGQVLSISSGIGGPIGVSTDAEKTAGVRVPKISGGSPTDTLGDWCIAAQSIAANAYGEAFTSGIFYALVKTGDDAGSFCEMESGSDVLVTRPTAHNASAEILQGTPDGTGAWCLIRYIGFKPNVFFRVNVTEDGTGVAGDATTACTFKYNSTNVDGATQLNDTAQAPEKARTTIGKHTAGTKGFGYYNSSGDFVLHSVDEVMALVTCSGATT